MRINTLLSSVLVLLITSTATIAQACSINFTSPARGSTVSTATVSVSGNASGFATTNSTGTARATVNGTQFFTYSGVFTTTLNFGGNGSAVAPLNEGPNVLFVTGTANGCTASDTMIVYYTPPPVPEQKNAGQPLDCNGTNPINGATGNKFQAETDFTDPSYAPLKFVRYYNSAYTEQRNLGKGWRSNYDNQLTVTGTTVYIVRADGMAYSFTKPGSNWVSEGDINDKLENVTILGVAQFKFTRGEDNGTEFYTANGRLSSMVDLDGRTLQLDYDALGRLASVTDQHSGRKLQFSYNTNNRIASLVDARGNTYSYQYADNIHLSSVNHPNTSTPTVREYKYNEVLYTSGANLPDALTGIIDENGSRFATFSYNASGKATASEHANGIDRHSLIYNVDGTTTVTDPQSAARNYSYQTILNVKRKVGQSQPAGSGCAAASSAITYDTNGNVATRNDFNGNRTTYVYDLSRNLETSRTEGLTSTGVATPETRTITTSYHPTWRLPLVISEYTGATGTGTPLKTTTMVYDDKGNVTSYSEVDPALSKTRTTTTTYTYSSTVSGLVLNKVVNGPRTDIADIMTYSYYPHDATCVASTAAPIIDPISGVAPSNLGCRGQLQSMTNALGHTMQYTRYNHHGQVEQMIDANNVVTNMSYDLRQRLLSTTVAAGTALAATTSYTYDGVGQLLRLTRPDASYIEYTYDPAHRLTDMTDTLGNTVHYILNAMGNITQTDYRNNDGSTVKRDTFEYDALNRLQITIDGNDNMTNRGYDANGNLTGVIDGKGKLTSYAIDKLDRTTNIIDALSGNTQTNYNAIDQSILVKAPNNAQTSFVTDALDNTTQELSPNRGTTTATYDNAGNALTISDARGILSTTTWDAINRPLTSNYPLTGENITYTWDAITSGTNTCSNGIGRLCQVTDAGGVTKFAYDARGNLITKTRAEAGISQTSTYSYDEADRMLTTNIPTNKLITSQRDSNGNIEQVASLVSNGTVNATTTLVNNIQTNALGQTTSQLFGNNITQSQSYNLMGIVASLDYIGNDPDAGNGTGGNGGNDSADIPTLPEWGAIIMAGLLLLVSFRHRIRQTSTNTYTMLNPVRAERVEAHIKANPSFKQLLMFKYFSILLAFGLISALSLNPLSISSVYADTPYATLNYDANQNIISRTTPLGTTSYGYDDLNRLNNEAGPAKTQSITYDANANRTGSTSPLDGSNTYTYTPNTDRLATINGQTITMDAAGNTLTARGYTYTWNQAGQLKEVKLGTGGSAVLLATYYYDYKNLRSRKETTIASPQGASITLYSYDEANHLQTEIRAAGGIATPLYSYVWRDDIPVAVIIHPAAQLAANPTQTDLNNPNTPDQLVYLEVDHLNTPRIGRDQAGKKVWSWESDTFGSTLANTDPDNNNNKVIINLRFPGQVFDQESGLHYNHHRYYDPQLAGGRYLNSDPSGLQGGLNNFAYANQSPLIFTDPTGQYAQCLAYPIGTASCALSAGAAALRLARLANVAASVGSTVENAGDAADAQTKQSEDNYHKICDQREPPGLDKCESAKFRLNRAQQCLAAREAFTQKYYNGVYDLRHSNQMQQVRSAIKNAQKDVDRFCKKSCP